MARRVGKKIMIDMIVEDLSLVSSSKRVELLSIGKAAMRKYLYRTHNWNEIEDLMEGDLND